MSFKYSVYKEELILLHTMFTSIINWNILVSYSTIKENNDNTKITFI